MAGQLTIDTLKASSGVLATQNGMTGIAKAWVNFTATGGTVVNNGSFNISSVTRISTGNFTVSFTTTMPNANYSVIGMVKNAQTNGNRGAGGIQIKDDNTPTTSSFNVLTAYGSTASSDGSAYDVEFAYLVVFSS